MCASSSTTRTLKLKAAIPSIHHHPVIRVSAGHDGNVNELAIHLPAARGGRDPLAGPGWGRTAVLTRAQNQLQRIAYEAEPLPDRLFQVAPVRKMEQADVVDEHHDRRRLGRRLGGITEPEAAALVARWWMLHEGLPQDAVELVGRDLDPALADDLQGRRNHGPNALLGFRGYGHDGRERRELEAPQQRGSPVSRLAVGRLDQVDLVDHDHKALPRFQRIAGDVLVLSQDARGCIEHE